ncbi:MAG: hypothetical protein LCH39_04455 [Proteobacteria bacterium]|nr:hypothetical protein [Pseudomonadota bacterium]
MGGFCKTRDALFRCLRVFAIALASMLASLPLEARSPGSRAPTHQNDAIIGVNFVNPHRLPVKEQDAMLDAMEREGVKVIRMPYALEKPDLNLIARAYQRGIKVLLIVEVIFPKDAPFFAWDKQNYPSIWSGHPLSSASPALSGKYYRKLMSDLDAAGIKLAGLQLGNEINSAHFNREFPVPGEGRHFGTRDLEEHPVGRRIAQGYKRYIEVLAELKHARNGSKLNQSTPLIAAGLVGYEGPEGPLRNAKTDIVSTNATLDYLRAHGADDLVDVNRPGFAGGHLV